MSDSGISQTRIHHPEHADHEGETEKEDRMFEKSVENLTNSGEVSKIMSSCRESIEEEIQNFVATIVLL